MTLRCQCGSPALEITNQSYSEAVAVESYECQDCGSTGTLTMHDGGVGVSETMGGCLESDLA